MKHLIFFFLLLLVGLPSFSQTDVHLNDSTRLSLYQDSIWQLHEVTVTARKQKKMITGMLSGKLELQMDGLESLPKFLGTTDPLRTMQLFSGVQTSGEANAGIYIRGGDPGHNLITLNEAPLYNAMHLLGFFSVFNGSHLDKFTLLKSHTGPEYGGRIGGVMAMQTKEEVVETFSAEGSIGLISSQGTLSIPITPKASLYASGRGTYVNWIAKAIENSNDNINMKYGFQDYNLTYIYQPNPKSKFIVNGYYGGDDLVLGDELYQSDGKIKWENRAASAQWYYHPEKNRTFKQTVFYSFYKNDILLEQNEVDIRFPSDITDLGYKGNYSFRTGKIKWDVGGDYVYHHTNAQYPQVKELFGTATAEAPPPYHTHEAGVFTNLQLDISSRLTLSAGLRYSSLFQTGEYSDESYNETGEVIRSKHYGKGELVKYYGGPEPRALLEYALNTNKKLSVSYNLSRQYMSQVAVSGIGFPTDFWIPSSKKIPPQVAHTVSAGYFHSLFNDAFEVSVEAYYKQMSRQTEFDGELFDMINQAYHTEEQILFGNGQNYGIEGMIKKNYGKFTGWISYMYGQAWRKFDAINDGKRFPAKHDRRHDLSIVGNYAINKKWDCSAVFVYATGNTFTMPVAIYIIGESAVNEYGPHNDARMPAYHRLDLSVNYWFKKNASRESGLNLSIYNAYARKNPIYLNVKVKPDEENKVVRISKKGKALYGLIPSISYTFKF